MLSAHYQIFGQVFSFSLLVSLAIFLVEQGRKVCVLCNLKPVAMRGIKSHAMVLAASNEDHTKVSITPFVPSISRVHLPFELLFNKQRTMLLIYWPL